VGGTAIALYNQKFDDRKIAGSSEEELKVNYNKEYLNYIKENKTKYGNNVVLNFSVDDLKAEYIRLKELFDSAVSKMMYVNIVCPYNFFMVADPDGNLIEITDV